MAVDKNTRKNTYGPYKGSPGDSGQDKAEIKEMQDSKTDLQYKDQLREDYIKDVDEVPDHLKENPNRNPDKPGIDNGKYN